MAACKLSYMASALDSGRFTRTTNSVPTSNLNGMLVDGLSSDRAE